MATIGGGTSFQMFKYTGNFVGGGTVIHTVTAGRYAEVYVNFVASTTPNLLRITSSFATAGSFTVTNIAYTPALTAVSRFFIAAGDKVTVGGTGGNNIDVDIIVIEHKAT